MVQAVNLTVPSDSSDYNVEALFTAVCDKGDTATSEETFLETVKAAEPWLIPDVIDFLVAKISGFGKEREPALSLLTKLDPAFIRRKLPDMLQPVINMCTDTSKKVREASLSALQTLVATNGNSDLDQVIPGLVQALKDQGHTIQAIDDLASCVFVQDVEAPALAVIMPIIRRGLRAKQTEIQRKSCVILDNVCRLVDDPKELSIAIPEILPLVRYCAENISKPEAREVAERALKTILDHYDEKLVLKKWSNEEIIAMIKKHGEPTEHIVKCTRNLCDAYHFDTKDWERVFGAKHKELCKKVLNDCEVLATPDLVIFEDTEEGADLYKGEFSLAYGTLTLLRKTRLHLKRNRFYGLLGPNNCGKTTLMRAIDHEQIEGFPKKDELKTLFVEHEIQEREVGEDETGYPIWNTDLSGTDWVVDYCNNVAGVTPPVTVEQSAKTMAEMGFGKDRAADPDMPVTTYSGGWKVKMQLVAATLINADLLMLDEPTGHLDVTNIAWLKGWLKGFLAGGGSIITTSHDSEFLEEMCTHIIDFQKKKLVTMKGNLKDFVEQFPEKKSYFVLSNEKVRFVFPEPGPLEGVKSLSKHILKMTGVTFQYPTRDKPTVMDICLEVSRVSRVAVIGPNGAGKSTAIKLLIGELTPSQGAIVKHPNMRLAYVAQHAFFHLEKHQNDTPAQYIMWRFAGNEDKESLEILNQKKEVEKEVTKFWIREGTTLCQCYSPAEEKMAVEPEAIINRHEDKKNKTKEYEVKWRGKSTDCNLWVPREQMFAMGAEKMVQKFDEKMAAESGLQFKPLTTSAIEKHLADFGIDSEDASHTLIKSLSGGQKIKVVIAASLWQNPHVIVLDEPTNYLDRDSLGALVQAIHDYKGGVIIISHNREFAGAVCQEKWIMDKGHLRREGESVALHEEEEKKEELGDKVVIDALGNEVKVKKELVLSDKEKKKEAKRIQKQINEGKKKKTLSEEAIMDLELKLEALMGVGV